MSENDTPNAQTTLAAATEALDTRGRDLKAVVSIPYETAKAEAVERDALTAAGISLGPLHGLPVVVKDIIHVAGMKTRGGSATRPDPAPATADAFVVSQLRRAGAIVAAKSATVEYAFGGWGTNASQGTPHNPYRPDEPHTPGGSSSGTGALVGAGIVPAGLGTDTGGSVRIPAAFCGCVGHKTSIGLVSRSGVLPLSDTFDTIGPLADTVARAADMLAAMQGEDLSDPSTVGIPRADPREGLDRGVSGLRLAALAPSQLHATTPEIMAHFKASIDTLRAAGATITDLALPQSLEEYQRRATVIIASDAYAFHSEMADDPAAPLNDTTRIRILMGKNLTARDRILAQRTRAADIADFLAALDRFDALILPASAVPPSPIATADEDDYRMSLHTRFGNYLDLCGLSVPIGLAQSGLPTSLQIVGRHLTDSLVLRIGAAYEAARGPYPAAPLN